MHILITGKAMQGSSPRVWGQDIYNTRLTKGFRIIPTRVGTSGDGKPFVAVAPDHPHACGDKLSILGNLHNCLGSSPRVWGQAYKAVGDGKPFGIIPTRVGTSIRTAICNRLRWDHPHACGDK